VYHFLCDLQSQGFQSDLGFNWDLVFPNAKFTPRLTYENVVLHLATWRLQRQDYHDMAHKADELLPAGFRVFAKKWNLPRFFTLADGDNELLVDAENALTVQVFAGTIRQRNAIQLKEFLFTPQKSHVRDTHGRPYVHQFIASFVRKDACYTAEKAVAAPAPAAMQREFWPGTEWLYYKLYCGVNTADQVLLDVIRPLAEDLLAARLIDKWFFVRFSDPHNHLRVRFHLSHAALLGETLRVVAQRIQPCLDAAYIWKSQLDTYSRELERYGHQAMEMTETLFFHDSVAVVNVLAQIHGQAQEDLRWLYGLKSVDEILNAFSYRLPEKVRLMQQVQESFAREFKLDKPLKLQLDAKYRTHKAAIRQALRGGCDVPAQYAALLEPLRTRNGQIEHLASAVRRLDGLNQLNVPLDSLLTNYIHMTLNRIISSSQRLHEMVIYDFLRREYKAESAMLGTAE
jgi:thiopeptide-type bacteriocin biosynthesis protein